ncbi:phage holin family protein [Ureibacillus acetophenoni]|uniref:phage holin family protein n=1 Tax=Ureibacillus acetophenoni TaxID=614649 RepID=UPI000BE369EE|nr:phage holin family protein [Ureibacillus acetophenoni]
MEANFLASLIDSRSYVLIPVLYIILLLLRQTPRLEPWTHAWIVMGVSIISCFLYYGFVIQSFVEGVLVAGVSILLKDLIHVRIGTNGKNK